MMEIISCYTDDIEVGERQRPLSEEGVSRLAVSMKELGLRQPINIRVVDEMEIGGEIVEGVPVLIAGRHRLEAAKRLGWTHIDCCVLDDGNVDAELWEVSENLHRLDLTREQRDQHIRRYAELLTAKRSLPPQDATPMELRKDGRRKGPQHEKGVARQIAEATGLSDDTIRRAITKPRKRPVAAGKRLEKLRQAWREAPPTMRRHFLQCLKLTDDMREVFKWRLAQDDSVTDNPEAGQ